jgi:deoxyadenosine/deoxycytidine kinase
MSEVLTDELLDHFYEQYQRYQKYMEHYKLGEKFKLNFEQFVTQSLRIRTFLGGREQ